jgi:hypothetical protein
MGINFVFMHKLWFLSLYIKTKIKQYVFNRSVMDRVWFSTNDISKIIFPEFKNINNFSWNEFMYMYEYIKNTGSCCLGGQWTTDMYNTRTMSIRRTEIVRVFIKLERNMKKLSSGHVILSAWQDEFSARKVKLPA